MTTPLSQDFYKQLKMMIVLQEKIDEYNAQIKELKERRDKLEQTLIPYMVKTK